MDQDQIDRIGKQLSHPGPVTPKEKWKIQFYEGINNTPAAWLATKGWLECVDSGNGDGDITSASVNANWDQNAFVASYGSLPVGVITFEHLKFRKELFIVQAYVVPECRTQGLYILLWYKAVEKARELGCTRIKLGTHVNNERMRYISRRLGMREESVILTFDV